MYDIKVHRGFSALSIFAITVVINVLFVITSMFVNNYIILNILELFVVIFDVCQVYYIIKSLTLKYCYDKNNIYILWCFGIKKITIAFKNIRMYNVSHGQVKGVKVWGYGRNMFALGTFFVNDIGIVNMFATSTKDIFYMKTDDGIYGISPEDPDEIEKVFNERKLPLSSWKYEKKAKVSLSHDRRFVLLTFLISIIILMITVIPFILYWKGVIPSKMPLSFDAKFKPIMYGTAREFAFKQMMYGAYNMAIFFCVYYAAYLYSKYSKKIAYRLMYGCLLVAIVFSIFQVKVFMTYIYIH
ncbi:MULTISPECIES: PH domain-containing protein [Clostridium]|uniref:PH domain-containing protein n=1 Tax=Clostridium TaxID=1485 RepID=UPI0008245E77|nr:MULTISPECIES: PH domain-containing protein [Clostridium]PJI07068.1 hypothetical protein CUB90_03965 [Clostridium sp. CT7]